MSYESMKTLGALLVLVGIVILLIAVILWFVWKGRFKRRMIEKYGKECCTHIHTYRPNNFTGWKKRRVRFPIKMGRFPRGGREEERT